MPRPPYVNSHISAMPSGVFSKYSNEISMLQGEVYPLHIGDTYFEPLKGARMEDIHVSQFPGVHRYTKSIGLPKLVQAISRKRKVPEDRVIVTAGATGALHVIASTLLAPEDEVLILAPYWPLIAGIVTSARGRAVSVPFFDQTGSITDRLLPFLRSKTVALYVNSPNNPTGVVLNENELRELAEFARTHNLWIFADEVYEELNYAGIETCISEYAPERSFSIYSFSKAYGMAGNRVGYIIGPEDPKIISQLDKTQTHAYYSVTTAAQYAAIHILQHGEPWIEMARERYSEMAIETALTLGVAVPQGGTFLFLDMVPYLDNKGMDGFLRECISCNLLLAPGESFGKQYENHTRICFTSAPPDVVRKGVDILGDIMKKRS